MKMVAAGIRAIRIDPGAGHILTARKRTRELGDGGRLRRKRVDAEAVGGQFALPNRRIHQELVETDGPVAHVQDDKND
jgi:hypothetical protein